MPIRISFVNLVTSMLVQQAMDMKNNPLRTQQSHLRQSLRGYKVKWQKRNWKEQKKRKQALKSPEFQQESEFPMKSTETKKFINRPCSDITWNCQISLNNRSICKSFLHQSGETEKSIRTKNQAFNEY